MSLPFSLFLDRLAERFAALLTGLLSSRVESLHAATQAEQQSELEDLARKYEADGKTEIAAMLRRRAARLTSADLAAEAVEIVERVTAEPQRLVAAGKNQSEADLRKLPDFGRSAPSAGKKRRKGIDIAQLSDGMEEAAS